jgi:hypothetical protein
VGLRGKKEEKKRNGEREKGSVRKGEEEREKKKDEGGGWVTGKRDGGSTCKNLIGFGDLRREKNNNRIRR